MIQLAPLKLKNKIILICQRVWKTVKCQGKIREKSGNFENYKWQPCDRGLYMYLEICLLLFFYLITILIYLFFFADSLSAELNKFSS